MATTRNDPSINKTIDGLIIWIPSGDWSEARALNNSWMRTYAILKNINVQYASDAKTGKFLGLRKEAEKKAKPGDVLDIWAFKQRPGQGTVTPGSVQYYWKHISRSYIADGPSTVTGSENSPKSRGEKDKKSKGGGDNAAKENAQFVKADTGQIKSNPPMLSVNYPDSGFLALQTNSRYMSAKEKQDRRSLQAQSSSKNPDDHELTGMAQRKRKGKYEDLRPKKGQGKRKRKISDFPQELLPDNKMRLGYIEQDLYLHSNLASAQGYTTKQQKKKKEKEEGTPNPHRYRFKFHYNPASVNVSQTYNQEIDPLFVQQDTFASIQSGSEVSFTLFLNRIEEMQILNHDGSFRTDSDGMMAVDPGYVDWAWRNRVPDSVRSKIRTLGTQYDLEFLYRVCNGEPLDTWRGKSSDYGILFGQPLRLHFTNIKHNGRNVGMNYYGFISGISMDHKMFSMDMVPSLTEVQITFTRIPDTMADDPKALGKGFAS